MKFETLLKSLPEYYNLVDREMLTRAYQIAEKAHENQKRVSGEPYISHCLAVAAILVEMKVPPEVVIAGILHDTVEDTEISLSDLKKEFGDDIAKLVDGVTKLTNLPRVSRGDQHLEESLDDNPESLMKLKRKKRKPNLKDRVNATWHRKHYEKRFSQWEMIFGLC